MAKRPETTDNMTITEAYRGVAAWRDRHTAIITPDERISYNQLSQCISAVAANMRCFGLSKGDRLVTLLWSQPEFVYLFFAAAELGVVLFPLPPRMRHSQLESYLEEIQPSVVVVSEDIEIPQGMECLNRMQEKIPDLRQILIVGDGVSPEADFKRWLEFPSSIEPAKQQIDPKDMLIVLFTSGTTGKPKGIMHSHRGLIKPVVASIRLRQMWMDFFPTFRKVRRWIKVLMRYGLRLVNTVGRQQVFLSTMSMHLVSGVESMLQALLMGDVLVMIPRFHPVRYLETIERERVTVLIGMPLAFRAILSVKDFDRYRSSSLIICGMGSAPCPPELAREIRKRFHCAVHIGFGLTETGGGIASTELEDSEDLQAETVGQPMPGMEVRIVDEAHQPLPSGSVGELACRSDSLMMGIFGGDGSKDASVDDQGWFYTGDLATMDENGYIRIVGRKKDLIIRGGQNIYPARIENLLAEMDEVFEATVVGIPDAMIGESVCVFVIPEEGTHLDEQKVLDTCRANLEIYEVPQRVIFVKDFPRSATGKPKKSRLREMILEEVEHHGE